MHDVSRIRGRDQQLRPKPSRARAAVAFLAFSAVAAFSIGAAETPKSRRQLQLDLVPRLNNDGVADGGSLNDGNFDGPTSPEDPAGAYPGELLLPAGKALKVAVDGTTVSFRSPGNQRDVPNNFTCEGQRFRIPPGRYAALYVLGACDKPGETVAIKFDYEASRQADELTFSHWLSTAREAGDSPALRRPYHLETEAGRAVVRQGPCTLWVKRFGLDAAANLRSVSVTYNMHVHVFAMTLLCIDWSRDHADYARDLAKSYRLLRGPVKATYESLQNRVRGLRASLARLPEGLTGQFPRQLQWVKTESEYAESLFPEDRVQLTSPELERIEDALRSAESDARDLSKGRDPFRGRRGVVLQSYHSDLDDTLQPYWLGVPKKYSGCEPFPLVVRLHGHGWYRPFQGRPRKEDLLEDAILLCPHGRGCLDYMLASEEDVLRCIEEVKKDYDIDVDRVYLTGRSMGGTGTWNIGTKYPDLFAGLAPIAGNADSQVWERLWGWARPDDSPIGRAGAAVSYAVDPVSYAENLFNVPVFSVHGSEDRVVPVEHSRSMVKRVWELPGAYRFNYREPQGVGHGGFREELLDEQQQWLLEQRREPLPKKVCLRTMKLRYGKAYWLKLESLEAPLSYATVTAEAAESGDIKVQIDGATSVSIDLSNSPAFAAAALNVEVNGAEAYQGSAPDDGRLTLTRDAAGKWRPSARPAGIRKKSRLEGPIEDAFLSPFVLVYGTYSQSPFENLAAKAEAERFAGDWERLFGKPCRMKKDTEVSAEDVDRFNLILYGGPACNLVTARIMADLPIRIEGDLVRVDQKTFKGPDVGVKFCYPNPLNPTRYVVVLAGTTWRGLYQIVNRFGNWFHWGPFDNRNWFDYGIFDDRTSSPETFQLFGFFDPDWKIDPEHQWAGYDKVRSAAQPRRVPQFASVSDAPPSAKDEAASTRTRLYLSDLLPSLIDQHKGVVNSDLSFRGQALRVGASPHVKGLGVRGPSAAEYGLGGRFERFAAEVGVDLEGERELSRVRKQNEWIQFEVHGDGKVLYRSNWLQGDSPPCAIRVPVTGVKKLRLQVNGSSARWHLGSAAWGSARVVGKGW